MFRLEKLELVEKRDVGVLVAKITGDGKITLAE